jgi:cytidyltransferase-like protein
MKKEIIVAASGHFDPLHLGHIEYLKKAKSLGDKLIVIVNNDGQTILKKGYEFMPLNERAEIIKSLKFVDEIFVSIDEDKTVCRSLASVRPDIFAKGGDRFSSEIPEGPICKELGIKIVDGLGDKIQSSSELVARSKTFDK